MDYALRNWYWKSLLEEATGGKVFGGMHALQEIRRRMAAVKDKLPLAFVEEDYPACLAAINKAIKLVRKLPAKKHAAIAQSTLADVAVRKVIKEFARRGLNEGAEYLIASDQNFPRRYYGEAAQKLIEEIAFFLAEEFPDIGRDLGYGIYWLSGQNVARHAFGPKTSEGKPLSGGRLCAPRLTTREILAKKYVDYLKERRILFILEEKLSSNHILTSVQEKAADNLWRAREVTRGVARRTVDVQLSRWKKAFRALTNATE